MIPHNESSVGTLPNAGLANSNSKWARLILLLLPLSAFSPYLIGSIRAEQLVAYPLMVIAVVIRGASWARVRPGPFPVILLLLLPTLISLVTLLGALPNYGPYDPGSIWAALDNQLLPIAVVIIIWSIWPGMNRTASLDQVGSILIWAMAVNAVFAIGEWSNLISVESFSAFFNSSGVESVAERSADQYRFTGIFNQPAEAGVCYSIALLAGLRSILAGTARWRRLGPPMVLILVGGLLAVSKIFIYGGLLAGVMILLISLASRRGKSLAIVSMMAVLGVFWMSRRVQWGGLEKLQELLDPQLLGLSSASAGRYGGESTVMPVVDWVSKNAPISGLGIRGISNYPYDSLYAQTLVYSGWVGVLMGVALIMVLILRAGRSSDWLSAVDRRLAFGILGVILAGSFGLPVLSANRVSVLVWTYLSLLLVFGRPASTLRRLSGY